MFAASEAVDKRAAIQRGTSEMGGFCGAWCMATVAPARARLITPIRDINYRFRYIYI
jgi:hypothetical protein